MCMHNWLVALVPVFIATRACLPPAREPDEPAAQRHDGSLRGRAAAAAAAAAAAWRRADARLGAVLAHGEPHDLLQRVAAVWLFLGSAWLVLREGAAAA